MAEGFAQATGRPALVNVHTGLGLGNAMGNQMTASLKKTPLIVTAGQQTREMMLIALPKKVVRPNFSQKFISTSRTLCMSAVL